jgi:hypothetical protein
MTVATLPPAERDKLGKLLALIDSDKEGERDAAIRAATRLLERHRLKWCEILSLPPLPKREPLFSTWRATCAELQKRPHDLRPWERSFVADLPAFPRISTKQRYVLNEIATRVFARAAG